MSELAGLQRGYAEAYSEAYDKSEAHDSESYASESYDVPLLLNTLHNLRAHLQYAVNECVRSNIAFQHVYHTNNNLNCDVILLREQLRFCHCLSVKGKNLEDLKSAESSKGIQRPDTSEELILVKDNNPQKSEKSKESHSTCQKQLKRSPIEFHHISFPSICEHHQQHIDMKQRNDGKIKKLQRQLDDARKLATESQLQVETLQKQNEAFEIEQRQWRQERQEQLERIKQLHDVIESNRRGYQTQVAAIKKSKESKEPKESEESKESKESFKSLFSSTTKADFVDALRHMDSEKFSQIWSPSNISIHNARLLLVCSVAEKERGYSYIRAMETANENLHLGMQFNMMSILKTIENVQGSSEGLKDTEDSEGSKDSKWIRRLSSPYLSLRT